ncbi:gamma-aminobutyric acid receptor subunit alpha-6-like [Acropora millepora]|uniref:gamma-aminobutyric acid receptor subunit alpha-6-like n=1 Tax=Acropora millepora TaxID=45264 RepID=UPI001CF16D94|nr:gamma-aminobutyric acid receptor subunit alpha-6-like [Acropora millepora]
MSNSAVDMNTRMAVGITTILTIVFLLGSANASLPEVSYAKAIDWYLSVSFAFIFAALVEYMLVFHFHANVKTNKRQGKLFNKETISDVFSKALAGSRCFYKRIFSSISLAI